MKLEELIKGNYYVREPSMTSGCQNFIFKYHSYDDDNIIGSHYISFKSTYKSASKDNISRLSTVECMRPATEEEILKYYNIHLEYNIKTTLL